MSEQTVTEFFAQFPELVDSPTPPGIDQSGEGWLFRLPGGVLRGAMLAIPALALVGWMVFGGRGTTPNAEPARAEALPAPRPEVPPPARRRLRRRAGRRSDSRRVTCRAGRGADAAPDRARRVLGLDHGRRARGRLAPDGRRRGRGRARGQRAADQGWRCQRRRACASTDRRSVRWDARARSSPFASTRPTPPACVETH